MMDLNKLAKRFWTKVIKAESRNDCWIWKGNVDRDNYGRFYVCGIRVAAHRVSYFLSWGYFPSHYHVDHKCQMKDCVNPWHLEAVTPEENRRRVEERRGLRKPALQ